MVFIFIDGPVSVFGSCEQKIKKKIGGVIFRCCVTRWLAADNLHACRIF